MNSLASKGRFGDTKIRIVDNEPAHVNALEASLIDSYGKAGEEFTKAVGSGTINPITGKKEYFDPITLIAVGSMAYKGWQNMQGRKDRASGRRAAQQQYAEQKGRAEADLRSRTKMIEHTYKSGMEKAKSAWDFAGKTLDIGLEKAITGAETALTAVGKGIGTAYEQTLGQAAGMARKSGLASSGQITAATDPSSLIQDYATSAKKTMDTRSLDIEGIDLQRDQAREEYQFAKGDLYADRSYARRQSTSQFQTQMEGIEDQYGQTLSEFAGTSNPVGAFVEGLFS